jgi:hypothetical protein
MKPEQIASQDHKHESASQQQSRQDEKAIRTLNQCDIQVHKRETKRNPKFDAKKIPDPNDEAIQMMQFVMKDSKIVKKAMPQLPQAHKGEMPAKKQAMKGAMIPRKL